MADLNLFQDTGRDAYIIYNANIAASMDNPDHLMSVRKRSDDYLSSLRKEVNIEYFVKPLSNVIHYSNAAFDQCFCYCADGASVTVYTFSSLFGTFQTRNNI
jgi:hypothetical protein